MENEKIDAQPGYCRMLGHDVNFSYCRIAREGLPCSKILDCWFDRFDVQKFMNIHYSKEVMEKILTPPKDKISTLYDLIQKAKQANM